MKSRLLVRAGVKKHKLVNLRTSIVQASSYFELEGPGQLANYQ